MIVHVFGEVDRTVGPGFDREGDLAKVLGVDRLVSVRAGGLQRMVSGTRQGYAALFGRMTQDYPTVLDIAGAVMEHPSRKHACPPRVILVGAGARRIDYHLGRDHDGGFTIEERQLIGDGSHMP